MNFNFENIFILGNKIAGSSSDIECDLTYYKNDDGELYSYIWDNEEDLIKWKNVNSIDIQHNLITFNDFLILFIFGEKKLKWMLLNSSSKMTDSKVSDKTKKEKLMLFSLSGIKPIIKPMLNFCFPELETKAVMNGFILNNPDLPPSELLSTFSDFQEELGTASGYLSEINNLSASDMFEKDLLLKHVVLNKIRYYKYQDEEFIDVKLELFGHCFKIVNTSDDLEITAVFDPKREIECRVINKDTVDASSYIVYISAPKTITYSYPTLNVDDYTFSPDVANSDFTIFDVSKNKFNKLKTHFKKVNRILNLLEDDFTIKINATVSSLLKNIDAVEMGENFINKIPPYFYTNIQYQITVDEMIYTQNNLGISLLLTSREINDFYTDTLTNFSVDNSNEIISYLAGNFEMFSQVLTDNFSVPKDKSILSTYVFIYNLAINVLSKQWDIEHKQRFHGIDDLKLDEAIERYCKIETIDHKDNITIGKFIYYLIDHQKFGKNNRNYFNCYAVFMPKFNELMENKKYNSFVSQLKRPTNNEKKYSINDVDLMDGLEFERFIAKLFLKMGFESEVTKSSGDQGIDVLASKNGSTIGIQAKCYSSAVSNSAIQEAVAGINHYGLDKAIVVTNNFFTSSAHQLAQSNSIILWDRTILKEKIDEVF